MALPQIGTIYPLATDSILGQNSLGPLYTQPGGPGTQVFPQQALGGSPRSTPSAVGTSSTCLLSGSSTIR